MKCPCHSDKPYEECCQPLHFEKRLPINAIELMRSRYAAYSLGLPIYVISTTYKGSPKYEPDLEKWKIVINQFTKHTSFEGLKILDHKLYADKETVTFHAILSSNGNDISYIERSTFKEQDGRIKYFDGVFV